VSECTKNSYHWEAECEVILEGTWADSRVRGLSSRNPYFQQEKAAEKCCVFDVETAKIS
jgi:hypothetical protein